MADEYELLASKTLLITGGTGSLGQELVERLTSKASLQKIVIYSRDEYKQHQMQERFDERKYHKYAILRYFLGDVRDKERLKQALSKVDYVIHAAALKQVPALEYNPGEAIRTNVLGTMNVVEACNDCGVKRATLVSTDKAVEPVNLYGATKLCAEKYFLAANAYNKTKFNVVRYGNVLGSRGSVVQLFENLIEDGETHFPITDKRMTRFWITLAEAVDLVLHTLVLGEPDSIYVPEAPAARVADLARAICSECILEEIGMRPGEKLHEILISKNEKKNIFFLDKSKAIRYSGGSYSSQTCAKRLTVKQLREKINDISAE